MSYKSGYFARLKPEDVRQLLLRLGIEEQEPLPVFREFSAHWFKTIASKYVCPANERRYIERLDKELGHLDEDTLLPGEILRVLSGAKDIGAATKNKIRCCGARIIDAARLDGKWRAGNPFTAVPRFREKRRQYHVLSLAETLRVLVCVRDDRRRLFRVAVALGARPGELFAIEKEDINLMERTVHIHRSHERAETKTGKERLVPIPKCVFEDVRAAFYESPSKLLFPADPSGKPFRRDTKLARQLRNAMALAGLVVSFDLKCRRKGCGYRGTTLVREAPPCPRCHFQLWLVPRVKKIGFRDLRHTCATLHREAGADPLCIKLLLGHSNADPTDDIYTHLPLSYQRDQLDKLRL